MTNTTSNTGTLVGKVALVTGGSRGIGAAIARRLAGAGAAVAITYVNGAERAAAVVQEITAKGGRALAIQADSADEAAVREAVGVTEIANFAKYEITGSGAEVWLSQLVGRVKHAPCQAR